MIRTGTCNRCGECCTGEQGYPVQKDWPDAVRNWLAVDVATHIPHLSLMGLGEGDHGELVRIANHGGFNLSGHKVKFTWIPKHGLCTDLEPYGDGETYLTVCPFLKAEKFGRRECALVGTQYEDWYTKTCGDMAPEIFTQEEVDEWFTLNPSCSYIWVEE